ncbi:MAG: hypothetical protein GX303_03055 [Clostridiales bacterium]|nr:hypothetical protein [Clostridiales bacterium]
MKKWRNRSKAVLRSFAIDRSGYGNMDDWLPVENIELIKKQPVNQLRN